MSSATATPLGLANGTSPGATLYWRASGVALAAVALLGFAMSAMTKGKFVPGFLDFDLAHNGVHLLLAVVALAVGFGGASRAFSKNLAKVVGVVYLALAAVGFVSADVFGIGKLLGLHLELGENLVHLVLGVWGAYAGFSEA